MSTEEEGEISDINVGGLLPHERSDLAAEIAVSNVPVGDGSWDDQKRRGRSPFFLMWRLFQAEQRERWDAEHRMRLMRQDLIDAKRELSDYKRGKK